MKLRGAGLVLAIASACLVVALATWDSQKRSSPGPITLVHERSAGIDGSDCEVCHDKVGGSLRAACAACHAPIEDQIARGTGFHGQLEDAGRCGACHPEHHGSEFELAGRGAFALAGMADRDAYRHEGLAFQLGGDHAAGLACSACHENADAQWLAKGAHRFGGESQACASCHADPHGGRLADCRSCHGETEPFAQVAEFSHPASFALAGAHARAGCVECHPRASAFAIEAGGSEQATRAARDCASCHASPHREPFLEAVAARLAVDAGASCVSCHTVEAGPFEEPAPLARADHAATGFPLVAPHEQVSCAECHPRLATQPAHAPAFAAFQAAYPGRSPDDCAACHADPHGDQFQQGRFADQGCLACHARERFDPPAFGETEHALTAFPLTGRHQDAACSACHAQFDGEARRFHGTDAACSSCHADAHAGFFARATDAGALDASGCAACHTTDTFDEVAPERFDHRLHTGFALEGEHARARCEACHVPRSAPDANGRSFGAVADTATGPPQACVTCHADVHDGYFAARAGVRGNAPDCSTCHDAHGFERAAAEFDHGNWTGFALDGAHARAGCAVCHPSSHAARAGADAALRSTVHRGEGSFADCATCHADVHGGAFDGPGRPQRIGGRTGCARCHTTESFDALHPGSFDHAELAGFELVGAHARAECSSCHAPLAQAEPAGRGFAPAKGTRCTDCHADSHVGQFFRNGRTDCARCHTPTADFLTVRFDHQRDSRFELDETHSRLDCSACHVPWPLPGGGSAVRYKPLGVECGDCHDAGDDRNDRRGRGRGRGREDHDEGDPR